VIHKQRTKSHYQLNYVVELLNKGICLLRPRYLQIWAQLGGGLGGSVSKYSKPRLNRMRLTQIFAKTG